MRASKFIFAGSAAAMCFAGACILAAGAEPEQAEPGPDEHREGLIFERAKVPVTTPEGYQPVEEVRPLPPDGSLVIDRLCRVEQDKKTGWTIVTFHDEPGRQAEEPRWALPCERLAKIEAFVAEHPGAAFRMTGESLVYRGRCFLLITQEPVVVGPQGRAETKPAKEPAAKPETTPESHPASKPATSRPTAGSELEPVADEIFQQLMRDRPAKPMDTSAYRPTAPAVAPSVAPVPAGAEAMAIGGDDIVVDRIVTIPPAKPDGGWREVRFKSDNTLLEPPLLLLPCLMLERAESMGGELRVSGLVTTYKGRRYLLLRKALRERDMGQF